MFPMFISVFQRCFNTQPPEGGWGRGYVCVYLSMRFQHTAARRRLVTTAAVEVKFYGVSTHSRPKAAGKEQKHDG